MYFEEKCVNLHHKCTTNKETGYETIDFNIQSLATVRHYGGKRQFRISTL